MRNSRSAMSTNINCPEENPSRVGHAVPNTLRAHRGVVKVRATTNGTTRTN